MVSALRRHELERFVAGLEPPGGEVS